MYIEHLQNVSIILLLTESKPKKENYYTVNKYNIYFRNGEILPDPPNEVAIPSRAYTRKFIIVYGLNKIESVQISNDSQYFFSLQPQNANPGTTDRMFKKTYSENQYEQTLTYKI